MTWTYHDGGRQAAGYTGTAGDCVTRALAIATGLPYQTVYTRLNELARLERRGKHKRGTSSARTGVYRCTYTRYLLELQRDWARGETYNETVATSIAHGGGYGLGLIYAKTMFNAAEGH